MKLFFHQLLFRPAFCTFIFLGILFYATGFSNQRTYTKQTVSVPVKIIKTPTWNGIKWKYSVQYKRYSPFIIYTPTRLLEYGATYLVKGKLKQTNPQILDLLSPPIVVHQPSFWHRSASQLHQEFFKFTETYLTKESKPFLQALIFNIKDLIEPDFFNALCKTNIVHIFSISGMHVLIVWKLIEWLLQIIPISKIYKSIGIVFLLYLYIIATGFQPPAFRAWIMTLFIILSKVTRYEADSLNLLGVAGCTILILQPYTLNELSFQLSFLCCLGLILFASSSKIIMRKSFHEKFLHHTKNTLRTTFIANLFSSPLIAFKFHTLSLLGWIVNLLLVPIIPLIIYLGIFCWITSYFSSFLAVLVAKFFLNPLINISIYIIYIFSNIGGSATTVPNFSIFWMGLIYLLMFLFWRPKRKIITKL